MGRSWWLIQKDLSDGIHYGELEPWHVPSRGGSLGF